MSSNGLIYCLHDTENNICRIGRTSDCYGSRIKSQMKYYPFAITYGVLAVDSTEYAEKYFHKLFLDKKINRGSDWFNITLSEFTKESEVYKIAIGMTNLKDYYSHEVFQNKIKELREIIIRTI
jgi:hypothetical protein